MASSPSESGTPTTSKPFRILALDGGGAKGFYTLGVLKEVEAMVGEPLHRRFDLVFGTSTGAIIAALITFGRSIDEIHDIYKAHVPGVMSQRARANRTASLARLAKEVFRDATFSDVKTGIGVVTAKWMTERPMIFKGSIQQAHGSKGTFTPGFGVPMADAVQASCSAYPFFERKLVTTAAGDRIEDEKKTWEAALSVSNVTDKFYYQAKQVNLSPVSNVGSGTVGLPREVTFSVRRSF